MNTRTHKDAALGVTMALAVVVFLAMVWEAGLIEPVRAGNLDVCPSGCPYATIQDAVYAAEDGDTIRVAAGTYTGSMRCEVWGVGAFTPTLCISEDIVLLGGYNPADFGLRDPDNYTTTVKWEGEPNHQVLVLANGTAATVDGFQITRAAGGVGTGIYIKDSSPALRHNRITGHHTTWGAGVFASGDSAATLEANEILSNKADESGGGVFLWNGATAVISDNLIADNEAGVDAGAILALGGSVVTVTDNLIRSNRAANNGGGVYVADGSVARITDNLIRSNKASQNGGGVYAGGGSVVTITNNRIQSNKAVKNGGGGFLTEAGATFDLRGNTFQGNTAGCCGGGTAAWGNATGTISGNEFVSNTADDWSGGGILLAGGSFDVLSNTVVSNQASAFGGGGIAVQGDTDATVAGNLVMSNTVQDGGGGIMIAWGPKAVVRSNQVLSNTLHGGLGSGLRIADADVLVERNTIAYNINDAYIHGDGAVSVEMGDQSRPVTITNNVIVDNVDKGIMVEEGVASLRIVNNTIASNRNEGILAYHASIVPLVRNNILVSNGYCGIAAGQGAEIQTIDYNDVWNNGGSGDANYCDWGGAVVSPAPGSGSISLDPQFFDAAAGYYHLASGSPAVDAGTSLGAPPIDREGVSRPLGAGVDMGAYELASSHLLLPLALRDWERPAIHGWKSEKVDPNGHGTPSLAIDKSQRLHLAYGCSGGLGSLCYAVKIGSEWVIEVVNAKGGEVSLALDAADRPHISTGNGELAYAHFDGSDWAVEIIEPYAGDGLGRNSALVLDLDGDPHITYYGPQPGWGPSDFRHAYYSGSKWITETVATDAWGNGQGFSSGLVVDSSGSLHALYTGGDAGPFDVTYAYLAGSTWTKHVIASGSGGSMARGKDGSLHASFVSGQYLRYAALVGTEWVIQDVAAFGTPHAQNAPGGIVLDGATSIQVDSLNRPHIAFYNKLDWDRGQLCYARFDGSQWIVEVVDTEGTPGFGRLSLMLDPADRPHIAYYDNAGAELRYAHVDQAAGEMILVPAGDF